MSSLYEEKDPECDLFYVPNQAVSHPVNHAIINAFGFDGNNVSMIVGKI